MDMRMPVMNGYEAAKMIRDLDKKNKTVIISLTASSLKQDEDKIREAGCHDLLRKPLDEQKLYSLMTKYLGIKFIYEQDEKVIKRIPVIKRLSSNDFKDVPSDWLEEFKETAVRGDIDKMLIQISRIDSEYPALCKKLTALTQNFDLDIIIDALDNIKSAKDG